jgi:hypothetical protein
VKREPMPVLLFLLIALAIWLFSCGSAGSVPAPAALKLNAGTYFVDSYVGRTEGTCEWLQRALRRNATVDAEGRVSPPLEGVRCATSYENGIDVDCTGFDLFTLHLHGVVELDGDQAKMAGAVTGNVLGCTRVEADVYLRRKDDP